VKRERTSQGNKRASRPASKRRPLDPEASQNRAHKEARLRREKGLKEPSKKETPGAQKSAAKKTETKPKEHFAKKFMKKPLESERPGREDTPSRYTRTTSRYPKKSDESESPGKGDRTSKFDRSDATFKKKPFEKDRPGKSDAPSKYSRTSSRFPKKTDDSERSERGDRTSKFDRSEPTFKKKPFEKDRPGKSDAPSKFSKTTSRYPKKSDATERHEKGDSPSKFSRPVSKLTKKPIESKRIEREAVPERTSRHSSKQEGGFQGEMRLNKYLAHCGIASRRAVDVLIMQGHATVNGVIVQEMGYKVKETDVVAFKGKVIKPVDKLVYYLLNKPRNVIATSNDERGRKTVMDIIAAKVPERIYPVGRLDRNTSGLILLTNDGDLTKKLSHPSHKVPKVYLVTLDKNLSLKDLELIRDGITLEDGEIKADSLHYMEGLSKREVQIEIHSGRNRLVRRIFEHLGYEVVKLDRTYYAGLTKKNLPRGMFRPLTKEEVRMLKHFS
jgi:23S rRNA pseudouridine2605 synthase